jgi:hypothetical protein
MDFQSNAFCASGFHFPNGSFATFGGNSVINAVDGTSYGDTDGAKSIRLIDPCTGDVNSLVKQGKCQWFDDASQIAMQRKRWYSTAEALANGTIVLIGGFVNGKLWFLSSRAHHFVQTTVADCDQRRLHQQELAQPESRQRCG